MKPFFIWDSLNGIRWKGRGNCRIFEYLNVAVFNDIKWTQIMREVDANQDPLIGHHFGQTLFWSHAFDSVAFYESNKRYRQHHHAFKRTILMTRVTTAFIPIKIIWEGCRKVVKEDSTRSHLNTFPIIITINVFVLASSLVSHNLKS